MLWNVYIGGDQMSREGQGVICGKVKQHGESVFVAAMHAMELFQQQSMAYSFRSGFVSSSLSLGIKCEFCTWYGISIGFALLCLTSWVLLLQS